jgi:peptidylprolyl isomerase domain and WD repeat-containing protein 1
MSDQENGTTALGKRGRDEEGVAVPDMPSADMDDSSDDEIGPMPTAGDGAVQNGRKKKRRAGE